MIQLKLLESPDKDFSGTFTTFKHQVLIGQSNHCDIIIKDPLIGKKHLYLFQDADIITAASFSKKHHYFRNGKKVTGKIKLSIDDFIKIGDSCFQIMKVEPLTYNPDSLSFLKSELEKINESKPLLVKALQDIKQEIIKIQVEENES